MTADRKRFAVRVLSPENPLTERVNRSGGIGRDLAIARANQLLESQRGLAMEAIVGLIGELEAGSNDPCCSHEDVQRTAERIVNLASLFGLRFLAQAAAQLCDGIASNCTDKAVRRGTVAVHVRAIRMLGPRLDPLPDHAMQDVVDALQLLADRFGVKEL